MVGATGAVGNQLVELLETRAFPKGELRLFAKASDTSSTIEIEEAEFEVEELGDPADLHDFEFDVGLTWMNSEMGNAGLSDKLPLCFNQMKVFFRIVPESQTREFADRINVILKKHGAVVCQGHRVEVAP